MEPAQTAYARALPFKGHFYIQGNLEWLVAPGPKVRASPVAGDILPFFEQSRTSLREPSDWDWEVYGIFRKHVQTISCPCPYPLETEIRKPVGEGWK